MIIMHSYAKVTNYLLIIAVMILMMLTFTIFHAWCRHCKKFFSVKDCDTLKSIVGLLLVIIIFAVIAALTSLAGSILGCISICSRVRTTVDLLLILFA